MPSSPVVVGRYAMVTRRAGRVLGAAAVLLLLTGCSSTVGGAGQATGPSAPASTAGAPSAAPAPQLPTSEAPVTTGTAASGSASAPPPTPVVLDDDSENWFATFCLAAAEVSQYAQTSPTGSTLAELQASVAAIYSRLAISASTSVGVLQATPAPRVDGGDDLQVYALGYFSFLSDVYGRGAVTIDGLTPATESDLSAAVQAIEQEAAASAPIPMTDIDPAVIAAANALPQCQGVL